MASSLADQLADLIAARVAEATERRQTRNAQRAQMAPRRTAGLAKRHAAKLARMKETPMDPTPSYLTEVRSFDHDALSHFPAYLRLRQALSDLANEVSEEAEIKLPYWLDAMHDMALTTPYGDMCSRCTKQCIREHQHSHAERVDCELYSIYWPHAVTRDGNNVKGTYRCVQGHAWPCGYAVDVMRYL